MAERQEPAGDSLEQQLAEAIEALAQKTYELLFQDAAAQGRRESDDRPSAATHFSYERLPEADKERYCKLAAEALKTASALGLANPPLPSQPNRTSDLLTLWGSHRASRLRLEEYVTLGKRANALGECLTGYDIALEGLKYFPSDPALLQVEALALARMGSWMSARQLLVKLAEKEDPDEETLGLLARTYKDLWLTSCDPMDLKRAYQAYRDAYQYAPERYWTGINTATLALVSGHRDTAYDLADAVRNVCRKKIVDAPDDERYWLVSTAAEASLVMSDIDDAEQRYAEAAKIGRENLGNLIATRRNLRILLPLFPSDVAARLSQAFQMPKVAVFTGHRADTSDRPRPRLPLDAIPELGNAIRTRLIENDVRVGYSSAASGSDILFLEALQQMGGRTHVVLPCPAEQFLKESVRPSVGDWQERYWNVLARADEVLVASTEQLILESMGYEYTNEILQGLARVQADRLDAELLRIAVWDGQQGDGRGGTADLVNQWRRTGDPVLVIPPVIDPKSLAPQPRSKSPGRELRLAKRSKVRGIVSEIRTMIFADACRFSKLSENQMPSFIRNFMGVIADLLQRTSPLPLYWNTWGDGLFFVFEKACDAGRFAVNLSRKIAAIDRIAAGLPEDMTLRIALHVGPVYRFKDPVTGRKNYMGSHVNRTARIEPSTPPGQVYGSDAFVAFAVLEAPGEFRCDYVGRIPLAKNFGEFPMYHIQAGLAKGVTEQ